MPDDNFDRYPGQVGCSGYRRIPVFPPHDALPHSKCFAKALWQPSAGLASSARAWATPELARRGR
jgi:hypothetical protein